MHIQYIHYNTVELYSLWVIYPVPSALSLSHSKSHFDLSTDLPDIQLVEQLNQMLQYNPENSPDDCIVKCVYVISQMASVFSNS